MKRLRRYLWFLKRRILVNATCLTNEVILITGMPRSGSTLIYNICKQLAEHHLNKRVRSGWINDLKFEFAFGDIVIIKIHDYDPWINHNIIIHSKRDLREIAASLYARDNKLPSISSLMEFRNWNDGWVNKADLILDYRNIRNQDDMVRRISDLMGIKSEKMNTVQLNISNQVKEELSPSYDSGDLWHKNHITGQGKNWKAILPKDYLKELELLLKDEL